METLRKLSPMLGGCNKFGFVLTSIARKYIFPAVYLHKLLLTITSSAYRYLCAGSDYTVSTEAKMNRPTLSGKKKGSHIRAAFLLLFLACAGGITETQAAALRGNYEICNRGSIDLWIAKVEVHIGYFWDDWEASGWYQIKKGECRNVYGRGGVGLIHLVFAVYTPDRKLGIVKYKLRRNETPSWFQKEKICVSRDKFNDSGSGRPTKYWPPCPTGYKAVPTSISTEVYEDDRSWVNVSPSPDDYKNILMTLD